MNCQVCFKKFTSVNNLYKHLQTNKKCLVMTNKKRINENTNCSVLQPVNKEFKMDMKLTAEEYNILMMYRSHRLHFEILAPDTDKNIEPIHLETVESARHHTEAHTEVVEVQTEVPTEVVEAHTEVPTEVVEVQTEVVEAPTEVVEVQTEVKPEEPTDTQESY